jgi:hypothetical protein
MATIYLAGGMEFSTNGAVWRKEVKDKLRGYGLSFWDPYVEEKHIFNNSNMSPSSDFTSLMGDMRKVVIHDLTVIRNTADLLFVKYDISVLKGAGTHSEMSFAAYFNKPVMVWLDGIPKNSIPKWAIGSMDYISYDVDKVVDASLEWLLKKGKIE